MIALVRTSARSAHRFVVALTVAGLLAVPPVPRPAAAAEAYEIDAILSLTGSFALLGNSEAASLRTLVPLVNKAGGVNGRPIHFNIADDQSQPAVAVQLANGIIAKHPAVMLGPTYVASCLAVAPLVRANGPVQYCFAPTINAPPGSYTFAGGASGRDSAIASLTYAAAKGWKRLALITTIDATGQSIEEQFSNAIGSGKFAGVSIIDREHFNGSDVTIAAQLAKIKAANPDAVLDATVGTATGTVLRSLQDAGLQDVPILSNQGNLLRTVLEQYGPYMPRQFVFTAPRFYAFDVSGKGPVRDAQAAFYRAFAAQGIVPDVGSNGPWDATNVIVAGLRKLGANADAKALLAYMLDLHGFAGTNGIYDYRGGNQRGQGLTSIVVVQWNAVKKGVVTVSEPGGKPLH